VRLFEFSEADALLWCARGYGAALVQQSIEALQLQRPLMDLGVWRYNVSSVRVESRNFQLFVHVARLSCGLGLVLAQPDWTAPLGFLLTILGNWPMRGTFNGGSDAMMFVLGLGLSVASVGQAEPLAVAGGLYFIAVHSVLSYFVAGVTKLKERHWRHGVSLSALAESPRYAVPGYAAAFFGWNWFRRGAASLAILFECCFPLSLVNPRMAIGLASLGAAFHLTIALVLGLHRFWPVWLATYPAIYWLSVAREIAFELK
jgi:hypothetical protein